MINNKLKQSHFWFWQEDFWVFKSKLDIFSKDNIISKYQTSKTIEIRFVEKYKREKSRKFKYNRQIDKKTKQEPNTLTAILIDR